MAVPKPRGVAKKCVAASRRESGEGKLMRPDPDLSQPLSVLIPGQQQQQSVPQPQKQDSVPQANITNKVNVNSEANATKKTAVKR